MRNLLKSLFVLLIGFFTLNSCSDEDENTNDGEYNAENDKIAGTKWIAKNWDFSIGDDWASILDETYSVYFYSSTEGMLYYGRKDDYSDMDASRSRSVAHFTYNVRGDEVVLDYITEPLFSNFNVLEIDGNTLSDASSMTFEREAMTADDTDWLDTLHGITGDCRWYHDLKSSIWIVGEGEMGDYSSYAATPWAMNNRTVNTIWVEEGVTSVGNYAFANPSIGDVDLPSTLNRIGDSAFASASVSDLDLPSDVAMIGVGAFAGCSYLDVYLPENLEEIGDYAFCDCKEASLLLAENIKRIGERAFMGCKVERFTDSEVLEEIGTGAFDNLSVSKLVLPNSLRTLGDAAFSGNISEIHVGTGLLNVGRIPFFYLREKGVIYVNIGKPLALTDNFLEPASGWTLYVPSGSKAAYEKAAYWKNFGSIRESSQLSGNGTMPDDGEGDNEDDVTSFTGSVQGHDYVDLGLSVKWATCNVGASLPEQPGDYYCWGRTDTSWDTPFLSSQADISGTNNDAATKTWGSKWQIPTKAQFEELIDNCTFTASKLNGNRVIIATSKINEQSIAFPLTGYKEGFYERGDTSFKTLSNDAVHCMTSEITDIESRSAKTYYFFCPYSSANPSCSNYFNLSDAIYSDTYKLAIRPVTE